MLLRFDDKDTYVKALSISFPVMHVWNCINDIHCDDEFEAKKMCTITAANPMTFTSFVGIPFRHQQSLAQSTN